MTDVFSVNKDNQALKIRESDNTTHGVIISVEKLSLKPGDFVLVNISGDARLNLNQIESLSKAVGEVLPKDVRAIFMVDGVASLTAIKNIKMFIDEQEKKNAAQNG